MLSASRARETCARSYPCLTPSWSMQLRTISPAPRSCACRDVVENQLVGAFVAVPAREVQNPAHDLVIAETHALHDFSRAHVEAGDDPPLQHSSASRRRNLPS